MINKAMNNRKDKLEHSQDLLKPPLPLHHHDDGK